MSSRQSWKGHPCASWSRNEGLGCLLSSGSGPRSVHNDLGLSPGTTSSQPGQELHVQCPVLVLCPSLSPPIHTPSCRVSKPPEHQGVLKHLPPSTNLIQPWTPSTLTLAPS